MSKSVTASAWAFARAHRQASARDEHLKWSRSRAARVRSKESRSRFLRMAIVCGLFVALLGVSLGARSYINFEIPSLDTIIMPREMARTGRITYRLADGRTCRYEMFDNDFGEASKSKTVPCEDYVPKERPRAQSARRFNWGGQ